MDMARELRTAVTFSQDLKATTDKQKEKKREREHLWRGPRDL